jgi:hypothetical protein
MAHGSEQLVNPLVAEVRVVPPPAGLRPFTKLSTPGEAVAAIALTPKALVVATVPSLRNPIPVLTPLPALVLLEMFKQTVVLVPAAAGVPELT